MEHGTTLLSILHISVALLLVVIVLLQDSKGGGMGGAFGGGSSQTIFGATGAANFMVKLTRGLAVVFMFTCIGLTLILSHRNGHSVVDTIPANPASPVKGEQPIANPATTNGPGAAGALPAPAGPAAPAEQSK